MPQLYPLSQWRRRVAALAGAWLWLAVALPVAAQSGPVAALYREHQPALFQVKVIDAPSGDRSALGTGFAIDTTLVATNYHVISQFLESAGRVEIRLRDAQDRELPAAIVAVDVVNDLALLRTAEALPATLALADAPPPKGTTLYALGNPLDLGMSVTTGIYNGIKEGAYPPQIHYAGPVNAGMSGGPAIDGEGHVVGINVATARNSVGLLVPVAALRALWRDSPLAELDSDAILEQVREQLWATQQQLMDELLAGDWPQQAFGGALVPDKGAAFISCWGHSSEEDDSGIDTIQRGCNSQSQVRIKSGFSSTYIEYEFAQLRARELGPFRFYQQAGQYFDSTLPGNQVREEDAGNYHCLEEFLHLHAGRPGSTRLKVLYCTRAYRQFRGLYDAFYVGMTTDRDREILFTHFTLSGFSRDNIQRFLQRFLERVQWQ